MQILFVMALRPLIIEGVMAIRLGLANIECCNGGGDGGNGSGVDGGGGRGAACALAKLFQVKILRRNQ
jgi:hypothetical protein